MHGTHVPVCEGSVDVGHGVVVTWGRPRHELLLVDVLLAVGVPAELPITKVVIMFFLKKIIFFLQKSEVEIERGCMLPENF